MSFKKSFSVLIILVLSSCAWLNDRPKIQKSFETSELDLSCLQSMPDQAQRLFAGQYSDTPSDRNAVQSIWKCIDRSLNSFSKYTRGEENGIYSTLELMSFANRYLPSDQLFNSRFVDSIFRLKRAVLGGDEHRITQNEIQGLRKKLNRFGEIVTPLAPYISTLLKPYDHFDGNEIQIASDRLREFVENFAELLSDSENVVEWDTFQFFVTELEKYLASPNPTSLTVIREQIQIFKHLKLLAVGGNELGIEKTKWKPIFKSIYAIYNAVYLTSTNADMIEKLDISIEASPAEQALATQRITQTLLKLKNDSGLYTQSTIQILSDRWFKALAVNAFLYPTSKDRLNIQSFLGSEKLRKVTAKTLLLVEKIKQGDDRPEIMDEIADQLITLIENTGISQANTVSLLDLRTDLLQLKPLMKNEDDFGIIDSSLSILMELCKVLAGKDPKKLSSKDLRQIIEKSAAIYREWKKDEKTDFAQAVGESLEILTQPPFSKTISVQQILSLVQKLRSVIGDMGIRNSIEWDKIEGWIRKGSKLKSILFGNSGNQISREEIAQLLSAWKAFNSSRELDQILEALTKHFNTYRYAEASILELYNAIESLLPTDLKPSTQGIQPEWIGYLKQIIAGGNPETISSDDYSAMAQTGTILYRAIKPDLDLMPTPLKLGVDSRTVSILEKLVSGLMRVPGLKISNLGLKNFVHYQLKKSGLSVKSETLDRLLIALNHRILAQNKGPKPTTYPKSFPPYQLEPIRKALEKIKLDLIDFENTFSSRTMKGSELYKKLTRSETRRILSTIHPILNADTNRPYFIGDGRPNDLYYLDDLRIKALIYEALGLVFPFYQIKPDLIRKAQEPRLSYSDLLDLFEDISDAIYELGLSYSQDTPAASATNRMQTINLFTRTGNGDEYIDQIETTEFLATSMAGKPLFDEVRKELVRSCYPQTDDYEKQMAFSFQCLKKFFFNTQSMTRFYDDVAPQLTQNYRTLNENEKEAFRKSTLTAVRAGWNEASAMPLADLETLVSIPYYVENMFLRMDHDYNSVLNFSEGMSMFPIFCSEIKKAAGDSILGSCKPGEKPRQIEAIYGHLLIKGTAPRSIKPEDSMMDKIKITSDFLLWVVQWNTLDKRPSVRDQKPPFLKRNELLNIIANLSTSIVPALPQTEPGNGGSSD